MSSGKYSSSPLYADLIPLPVPSTSPHPLAQIAYSDAYVEATSYLRAIVAANEKSERVLEITEDVIRMNPAHYTVWLYRAATLLAINADLNHELTHFLNPISLRFLKNYQIWHHRQTILSHLPSSPQLLASESAFLASMFEKDAKNYHVWSYRQWFVRRFNLWDDETEWSFMEGLINEDIRNNSAWSFRWFLNFAGDETNLRDAGRVSREVEFAKGKIRQAPQNESSWNYLRGLLGKAMGEASVDRKEMVAFAEQFVTGEEGVVSSHAMDLLATLLEDDENEEQRHVAVRYLEELAGRYDPIREKYWLYRKACVESGTGVGFGRQPVIGDGKTVTATATATA